ncbi:MAG: right-handed parallel beta-helix repeat-containing protein [Candidatus Lokiarchaeota archaeon]|nr:right-handed parallel beta-helix repeat-containing protein [Candidatus Lokiarchaeota archaeon]
MKTIYPLKSTILKQNGGGIKRKKTLLKGFIFLFFLVTPILLSPIKIDEGGQISNPPNKNIKNSYFWVLPGPIVIDDFGSYTWADAVGENWCNGSGIYSDPYIIENVTINGGNSSSCIEIRNSTVYFIIRNCTVFNSTLGTSNPYYNAGIKLVNTTNGKILDNNCSDNNGMGIYLYNDCHNNTVSGNNVTNNLWFGIQLRSNCDNNTVSENTMINNYLDGIYLYGCSNNNISGNAANENRYGIYLYKNCNNNTVSENAANENSYGIYLYNNCNNNTVSENTLKNNNVSGIYLQDCSDIILSENTMMKCGLTIVPTLLSRLQSFEIDTSNEVNQKPIYYYVNEEGLEKDDFMDAGQVFLVNCSYCTISGVNASRTSTGISLYSSSHNDILGNNASNNSGNGIELYNCNDTAVLGNNASYNLGTGIYLDVCNNTAVSRNTASDNKQYGVGQYLYECNNSTISGNILNRNYLQGVCAIWGDNINISNNTCNENQDGIDVWFIDNITISGNTASLNQYHGLYLMWCNNGTISENNASNNLETGITLNADSSENIITKNLLINNDLYGMVLDSSGVKNNTIWLNSFVDNGIHAKDDGAYNQWDNGGIGNFWDDYSGTGSYFIQGTATSEDRYPLINTTPIVDFSANNTNIILGQSIQFNYTGGGGNLPLTFEWNFGDGTVSREQDPIHVYDQPGIYLVNLSVIDVNGDNDTETKAGYITVSLDTTPNVDFSANETEIIQGQPIKFTFNGMLGNSPFTFEWHFGDGINSTEQDPVHTYNQPGVYSVNLIVIDVNGDNDTETKAGYINVSLDTKPNVDFSANETVIIQGQPVRFMYRGSGGNAPLAFFWEFGDGTNSTDQVPVHVYDQPDLYVVALTITDFNGDSGKKTGLITVLEDFKPTVNFSIDGSRFVDGRPIQFFFTGNEGNAPLSFYWEFGDGTSSTEQNPVHAYESPGIYNVTLTITDANGDVEIMTMRIEVFENSDLIPFFPIEIILIVTSLSIFTVVSSVILIKKRRKNGATTLPIGKIIPSDKILQTKMPLKVSSKTTPEVKHELVFYEDGLIKEGAGPSTKEKVALETLDESGMDVEKQKYICIVHKGPVKGENVYICPHCQAFYCKDCVNALREQGEKCWSCQNYFT